MAFLDPVTLGLESEKNVFSLCVDSLFGLCQTHNSTLTRQCIIGAEHNKSRTFCLFMLGCPLHSVSYSGDGSSSESAFILSVFFLSVCVFAHQDIYATIQDSAPKQKKPECSEEAWEQKNQLMTLTSGGTPYTQTMHIA